MALYKLKQTTASLPCFVPEIRWSILVF